MICPRYFTICAWNYYCPYYNLLLLFVTPSHVTFDDFLLYVLFPGSRQSVASSKDKVNPVIHSVSVYTSWLICQAAPLARVLHYLQNIYNKLGNKLKTSATGCPGSVSPSAYLALLCHWHCRWLCLVIGLCPGSASGPGDVTHYMSIISIVPFNSGNALLRRLLHVPILT